MIVRLQLFAVFFWSLSGFSADSPGDQLPQLVVSTYDSIVAKGGLGPMIFPLFEKRCHCHLSVLSSGNGEQLVGRLELDAQRGKPTANVVMGLDESNFNRAKPELDLEAHLKTKTPYAIEFKAPPGFVPYDYGFFSFIADQDSLKREGLKAPQKFSELLKPEWRRNLILEDPRTSTPGMAFLLYVNQISNQDVWSTLRSQWLTLTPSWDAAYGLFLKQEAPLVWSYTTSQAYHEQHGDLPADGRERRYSALVFEEGLALQVEGASIVQGSFPQGQEGQRLRELALEFLQFLQTPDVQSQIPLKNWMYPIVKSTELPQSFKNLPKPLKIIHLPVVREEVESELSKWTNVVSKSSR